MGMINPGSGPVEGATEEAAAAALEAFVAEVGAHEVTVDPVRRPDLDTGGRFGWLLRGDALVVPLLMPGTDVARLRDVGSAATPCLNVAGNWWWWRDAVGQVVRAGTTGS